MLNLTTNKIIGIVGGVAGVSAAGAGVIYLTSDSSQPKENNAPKIEQKTTEEQVPTKSIIDLLKEKAAGKVMLSTNGDEDSTAWNANWDKFKKKYDKARTTNTTWKFQSWEEKLAGNVAIKEFKDKCTENSQAKVKNEQEALFEEVKEFCTKDKSGVGG